MERLVRHFMVLLVVVAFIGTDLPQLVARFFTNDFHIADLYYSIRGDDEAFVEDIVLVNIGPHGRGDIAKELFKLAQYEPKVIGVDVIFQGEREPESDALLQYVLMNVPNVVLIGERQQKSDQSGDSLVLSHPMFSNHTYYGIGENILEHNIGRRMRKQFYFADGDTALHFAVQMAMLYDSAKAQRFIQREHNEENIYFRGNIISYEPHTKPAKFAVLDYQDVIDDNFTPDLIKGKIVLMGYLGEFIGNATAIDDKFYSPLTAFEPINLPPDMFGAVFHANSLSMILNEDYIDALTEQEELWLACTLGLLNILLFLGLIRYELTHHWYVVISSIILAVELMSYPQLALYLFDEHRYLLNLTYTPFIILLSSYFTKLYVHPLLCAISPWWRLNTTWSKPHKAYQG